MQSEEIQAGLLYMGAVALLWAFGHGFAAIRTLSNKMGTVQHGWMDLLVIGSGIALLIWPFVPGTLLSEYDFSDRWHIAVLVFIAAWVGGWLLGWVVLALLAPAVGPGADEMETGGKFLALQYPVMLAVAAATAGLWWGTLDQLRY